MCAMNSPWIAPQDAGFHAIADADESSTRFNEIVKLLFVPLAGIGRCVTIALGAEAWSMFVQFMLMDAAYFHNWVARFDDIAFGDRNGAVHSGQYT